MEFHVLGPLEVVDGDRPLALGGAKQRALLAHLLLNANTVVSTDRLIDVLWGEDPPDTAAHTLHVYIARLRKVLRGLEGSEVELATEGRGYALRLAPDEVDLYRFQARSEAGRRMLSSGDLEGAALALQDALAIWRGDPLSDLPYGSLPYSEIARLQELRLAAFEDRIEAYLGLGRHQELVGELTELVTSHPLRERLRGQQMLALYRSGRQAEALQSFRDFQRKIGEELGIDPGQPLQRLEQRILQQDPHLEWTRPPLESSSRTQIESATAPAARRARRPRVPALLAVGGATIVLVAALAIVLIRAPMAAPTVVARNGVGRIDLSSAELEASIPTAGLGPGPLTWFDGSLWVANTRSGTVARISPAESRVVQSVPADGAPTDLASGEGAVWVLNGLEGTVRSINPRTNEVVATVTVPEGSGGIAVGAGFVWVTNTIEMSVTKINPASGMVVDAIRLGPMGSGSPKSIAVDAHFVWVGDELAPAMWQIDAATDDVIANPGLRGAPTAMTIAPDGSVWIASYGENLISHIDPSSLQATTYGIGPGPVDLASGDAGIWVAQSLDGTVSRIDPSSGRVLATTSVGGSPGGVALGGGALWVSRPA